MICSRQTILKIRLHIVFISIPSEGADNLPYEKIGKETRCIVDEIPFEIPDSWEWVTLRHIAITELGKTLDKAKNQGTLLPYLCSINVYWTGIDLSKVKQAKFENDELERFLLQKGDLLVCEGGDIGRCAIWDSDQTMYYQNALHRIRFFANLNSLYFRFLLECYKGIGIIDQYSKGMTIKHLVQSSLNSIMIPLPPLAEQKRIVAKIEELLPHLEDYDRAETRVTKLNAEFPEQLKKSILQWAIQGKLVPQDPADEPASVLLEHIRAEKAKLVKAGKIKKDKNESVIFRRDNSHYEKLNGVERCIDDEIPFDIPENWAWARCMALFQINPRNTMPDEALAGFIPMTMLHEGFQNSHTFEMRKWSEIKNGFTCFQNRDIVIAKITPCFQNRKSAIISGLPNDCGAGSTELHVLRDVTGLLFMPFFLWIFKTHLFIEDGKKHFTGTAGQQRIGKNFISTYLIPLPPLPEQKRIVAAIDCLFRKLTG